MSDPTAYPRLPTPGTYRISSVIKRTSVLEIPDYNEDRVVLKTWNDKPNQRWFVQRSGRGYKIKNCQFSRYLSAPNNKNATIVGAAEAPVVWCLLRTHAGFAIQFEETDHALDLHYGLTKEGNIVSLWPSGDFGEHRRWIFEHINDDTGGEAPDTIQDEVDRLKSELEAKNAQLELQAQELARLKDQKLVEQGQALSTLVATLHQVGFHDS
ncbi:hypothetical protein FRC12_003763 [Ceratobasidium sp. 428]|nr:hypothetical protein FRC12_003763 [Ceratobasidium sp. 428]